MIDPTTNHANVIIASIRSFIALSHRFTHLMNEVIRISPQPTIQTLQCFLAYLFFVEKLVPLILLRYQSNSAVIVIHSFLKFTSTFLPSICEGNIDSLVVYRFCKLKFTLYMEKVAMGFPIYNTFAFLSTPHIYPQFPLYLIGEKQQEN